MLQGISMGAIVTTSGVLNEALRSVGLEDAFDERGLAFEDCPGCGAQQGLKLSLARGLVQCGACGSGGPLLAYLREKAEAADWNTDPYPEAEIIPIAPRLPTPSSDETIRETRKEAQIAVRRPPLKAELIREENGPEADRPPVSESIGTPVASEALAVGRLGERIIMTLLALLFLGAGLAAALLSGFANYQAFSLGVGDPAQSAVWGWSGVIASICSFGGFTFFWWHLSGRRKGEALRSLVFALAGACTSIAGTSLYMINNQNGQVASWQSAEDLRQVTQAEIADWSRQLGGIPPETRSIAGLEAYLAGVEAAGRTHQKPYRDAHNELGLAQRRAELEQKISTARSALRETVLSGAGTAPARSLPAWFFALMLELFSSQATSIAFVSLLLLYGRIETQDLAAGTSL